MTVNKRLGRRADARPRRKSAATPADDFRTIAEDALLAMAHVPASVTEYTDGLRLLIDLAETALGAAEELEREAEEREPEDD